MTDPALPTRLPAAESPLSLPLERRLTLVVLILFALVLGASLGVSYFEVRRAAELSAADRLSSLAEVLGSTMTQQLATRGNTMRRVARTPAIVAAVETAAQPLSDSARAALAQLAATPGDTLAHSALFTRDGRAIGPMKLETPMDADRLRDVVLATGDSVYVGPLRNAQSRVSFVIAVPVRNAARRIIGVLAQERQSRPMRRGTARSAQSSARTWICTFEMPMGVRGLRSLADHRRRPSRRGDFSTTSTS